jgi:hypothetical protein
MSASSTKERTKELQQIYADFLQKMDAIRADNHQLLNDVFARVDREKLEAVYAELKNLNYGQRA